MKSPLRILYLEDEKNDVELVQAKLEEEGFNCKVTHVETRSDFIAALERSAFDIILADYKLPSFDGLSALAIALKKDPLVPFVFVSGVMGEDLAIESLKSGATDYVLKQRLSRLIPAVKRALTEAEERNELKKAEEKLKNYQEHLEELVEERTAKLEEANKLLQRKEQEIRLIADNVPAFLAYVDREGIYRFVNKSYEERYGISREEIIGKHSRFVLGEHVYGAIKDEVQAALSGKRVVFERAAQFGPGDNRWISVNYVPHADEDGNIIGYYALVTDITERRRMEQALRESELRYREVFDNSSECIFLLDVTDDGRFKFAGFNPAEEKSVGFSNAEVSGKFVEEIVSEEMSRDVIAKYRGCMEAGTIIEYDETINLPVGRRDFHTILIPVRNGAGRIYRIVGMAHDITDRKRAEQELKHLTDELARSNADLQEFAYVASHDLQEPLRVIDGFIKLLGKRYRGKLDEKADEFIELTTDGVKRAQEMIKDLLEYSKVGMKGINLKPLDISLALDKAVLNLKTAIEESGATVTHGELPTVMADASQISRLFQNLIGNAIKFRRKESLKVHISAERKDNQWVFSVRDNGIGVDRKAAERIFVVFQRLHKREAYPGTGIGLAICKKIVERHGGRIWVESEPGKGSTFHFAIPNSG